MAVLVALGLAAILLVTDGEPATPSGRDLARTSPAAASRPPEPSTSDKPGTSKTRTSAKTATAPPSAVVAVPPAVTKTPTTAPTRAPTPTATYPTVPNVVGMPVAQAAGLLANAGYDHQVVCQEGVPTGTVAAQQPAGGQRWNTGGQVALFVAQDRCRGRGRPDNWWND